MKLSEELELLNKESEPTEMIFEMTESELNEHDEQIRAELSTELIKTINRFNFLCELEMNAHEPYKATRPLNLERLHRVKDKMLKELKEQKG